MELDLAGIRLLVSNRSPGGRGSN